MASGGVTLSIMARRNLISQLNDSKFNWPWPGIYKHCIKHLSKATSKFCWRRYEGASLDGMAYDGTKLSYRQHYPQRVRSSLAIFRVFEKPEYIIPLFDCCWKSGFRWQSVVYWKDGHWMYWPSTSKFHETLAFLGNSWANHHQVFRVIIMTWILISGLLKINWRYSRKFLGQPPPSAIFLHQVWLICVWSLAMYWWNSSISRSAPGCCFKARILWLTTLIDVVM